MRVYEYIKTGLAIFICSFGMIARSRADVIVDIGDLTMFAGSIASFDVTVRSTSSDPLMLASVQLSISPIVEIGGSLQFADSSDSTSTVRQQPNELADSNYLFLNHSGGYVATRDTGNVNLLTVSDFSSTFSDINLDTHNSLLARIEVQHLTPFPLTSSGLYQVSLVQNPNLTYFQSQSDSVAIDAGSFSSGNSGQIRVVATAVPEPTSGGIWSLTAFVCAFLNRRRRSYEFPYSLP